MNKLYWVVALFLFSSCEKNINFTLDASEANLVIDAQIENDRAPVVTLTKSVGFFSEINPMIYASVFVHNAAVYISNGTLTHKLKEVSTPSGYGFNSYYYSIDSSNLSTAFLGELNTNYTLRVVSEDKEYLSSTTIPGLDWVPDTLFYKINPFDTSIFRRDMYITYTEPRGIGNCCRYFTNKNGSGFLPASNSVFNDEIIDGTTITTKLIPGIDRNDPKPEINFFVGDTVSLKFCNIDKATYTFWNTWEFSLQTIGNPFSQPNKVIGNISNGALGAFCGYAAWYKTTIVQ
jgi:hypothetical protein